MQHNGLSSRLWMVFFGIGLLFMAFGLYNLFFIPMIDPADPEMGWDWLSTDPVVIAYIKFNFQNYGLWILSGAVALLGLAATGYRAGARFAWWVMWYVPLHIGLYLVQAPWLMPVLVPLIVIAVGAQIAAYRHFFARAAL